jgi:hypothetical protein
MGGLPFQLLKLLLPKLPLKLIPRQFVIKIYFLCLLCELPRLLFSRLQAICRRMAGKSKNKSCCATGSRTLKNLTRDP